MNKGLTWCAWHYSARDGHWHLLGRAASMPAASMLCQQHRPNEKHNLNFALTCGNPPDWKPNLKGNPVRA